MSMGSALVGSSNFELKIFRKKNPDISREQNLNLPHDGSYSQNLVFTTIYIDFHCIRYYK